MCPWQKVPILSMYPCINVSLCPRVPVFVCPCFYVFPCQCVRDQWPPASMCLYVNSSQCQLYISQCQCLMCLCVIKLRLEDFTSPHNHTKLCFCPPDRVCSFLNYSSKHMMQPGQSEKIHRVVVLHIWKSMGTVWLEGTVLYNGWVWYMYASTSAAYYSVYREAGWEYGLAWFDICTFLRLLHTILCTEKRVASSPWTWQPLETRSSPRQDSCHAFIGMTRIFVFYFPLNDKVKSFIMLSCVIRHVWQLCIIFHYEWQACFLTMHANIVIHHAWQACIIYLAWLAYI